MLGPGSIFHSSTTAPLRESFAMSTSPKMMKSCDSCKARKVRCTAAIDSPSCANCLRRGTQCHYSPITKPRRSGLKLADSDYAKSSPAAAATATATTNVQALHTAEGSNALHLPKFDGLQELYIDRLLRDMPQSWTKSRKKKISPLGLGVFGNDYSLTFFSEARLASLSARLGHSKVNQVIEKVASIISERMNTIDRVPTPPEDRASLLGADKTYIVACIAAYFEQVHPFYPFLHRRQFESLALGSQASHLLTEDKAWSALLYAVLALGSQYHDGGSFQPGKNMAWRFFSAALALFPDLMISKCSLTTIQAITAMAIYASSVSCMQIGMVLVLEGAKKAQTLEYNKATTSPNDSRSRCFWVLYCLEKMLSFNEGRTSFLNDSDISCAIAPLPEPKFGCFDWLLTFVRHARLLSRIHTALYSVSAAGQSLEYYRAAVRQLMTELEMWKSTIPTNLQPSESLKPYGLPGSQMVMICIMVNYLYYNTALTLHRTALQLETDGQQLGFSSPPPSDARQGESMLALMKCARSILELTRYIEVEPHIPLWVLASVPLSALFVLFDLVIHNPHHPETSKNLAVLDVGGGYFSRIEYKSDGALPGSLATEFSHIARQYVRDTKQSPNSQQSREPPHFHSSSSSSTAQNAEGLEGVMSSDIPHTVESQMDAEYDSYDIGGELSSGTNMMAIFGSHIPGVDAIFGFGDTEW